MRRHRLEPRAEVLMAKREIKCSNCGGKGHNVRSCKKGPPKETRHRDGATLAPKASSQGASATVPPAASEPTRACAIELVVTVDLVTTIVFHSRV